MPPPPRTAPRLSPLSLLYCAANLIGVAMMFLINLSTPLEIFEAQRVFVLEKGWLIALVFFPLVFGLGILLLRQVERPVAAALALQSGSRSADPALRLRAERRLLNLPFAMAAINLAMWIVVASVIGLFFQFLRDAPLRFAFIVIFRGVMIGLITSSLSFFFLEAFARSRLMPWFFAEGRQSEVPRVFRMSIVRRIRMLYGSGTINPMLLLIGTLASVLLEARARQDPAAPLVGGILTFSVVLYSLFVIVALGLNYFTGRSILAPLRSMIAGVRRVRQGDFNRRVAVVSNDELGVLGDGINEMMAGLRERERLQRSIHLAKEVQQALLPKRDPTVDGLDVSGTSVYCDETGGDYFDYLGAGGERPATFDVVVGDVSGHGISAALLMASCRALLRQRSAAGGSPGAIVSDVNRLLERDVEDSGSFTTLFFMRVALAERALTWVRAGHEPALLYDPAHDRFHELRGGGPALGVHPKWAYAEHHAAGLDRGQIVVIGTDGIWEARNSAGEMFGRERLWAAVRRYRQESARGIVAGCLEALERFRQQALREDDTTLVVIKITANLSVADGRGPRHPK
jgi:sigma-B regulation protein RsbU (phosphoserine phosphatase)